MQKELHVLGRVSEDVFEQHTSTVSGRFLPTFLGKCYPQIFRRHSFGSLRASSPIWASEASLARTRERGGFAARSRVLARLASLAQIGELARRLIMPLKSENTSLPVDGRRSKTTSLLKLPIVPVYSYAIS